MRVVIIEDKIFKIANKLHDELRANVDLYEEYNIGFLNIRDQKIYDKMLKNLEHTINKIRSKYTATEIDTDFRF